MILGWNICCRKVQQRWMLAFMGCLAAANAFMMRTCLSATVIEMVAKTESSNDTSSNDTCSASDLTSSISSTSGTYEWSEYTQTFLIPLQAHQGYDVDKS